MAKRYVNGTWVTVSDTSSTKSTTTNSSSQRPTSGSSRGGSGSTSTSRSGGSKTSSSKSASSTNSGTEEYIDKYYDAVKGSVVVTKPDMSLKPHMKVGLYGLGKGFSTEYLVTGVKISLNAVTMKQTITVEKDSLSSKTVKKSPTSGSRKTSTKSGIVNAVVTKKGKK